MSALPSSFDVFGVIDQMRAASLPDSFVLDVTQMVREIPSVAGMLELWLESEGDERDEIVADLQDLVDDWKQSVGPTEEVYIRFDDLDTIAQDIMAFKDGLRAKLDDEGITLTELSERTGMPLPSLSRFFGTPSMPRRYTLIKIARAVDFSAVEIATDWDY